MRKQYHSKKIEGDIFIWDVHRLIAESKSLPIVEVKLCEIREFEENYWYQGKDGMPTCKSIADHMKLVQECDLGFPIILADDGSVMDGMHRICKAYLNGHDSIRAVKFEKTPKPDFKNVPLNELPYD